MTASDAPGPVYIDASALAKIYFPERESRRVDRLLRGRRDLVVSDLAVTEVVAAAARKRREGLLSLEALVRLHSAILADFESGMFQRAELLAETHRLAERMLLATEFPLRGSDALHLALAVAGECASILSFDARMNGAALEAGLQTLSKV